MQDKNEGILLRRNRKKTHRKTLSTTRLFYALCNDSNFECLAQVKKKVSFTFHNMLYEGMNTKLSTCQIKPHIGIFIRQFCFQLGGLMVYVHSCAKNGQSYEWTVNNSQISAWKYSSVHRSHYIGCVVVSQIGSILKNRLQAFVEINPAVYRRLYRTHRLALLGFYIKSGESNEIILLNQIISTNYYIQWKPLQTCNLVVRVVIKMLLCTEVSLQTLIRGVNVKFNYANALHGRKYIFLIKLIFWGTE